MTDDIQFMPSVNLRSFLWYNQLRNKYSAIPNISAMHVNSSAYFHAHHLESGGNADSNNIPLSFDPTPLILSISLLFSASELTERMRRVEWKHSAPRPLCHAHRGQVQGDYAWGHYLSACLAPGPSSSTGFIAIPYITDARRTFFASKVWMSLWSHELAGIGEGMAINPVEEEGPGARHAER